MLLFLLVVLVEFIQNMSVYNTKASSRKGDTKENFLLQRFLKQNYEQRLLHNNVDEGMIIILGFFFGFVLILIIIFKVFNTANLLRQIWLI
jgi:hypothetical protein